MSELEPRVTSSRRISGIWILPLVAVAIGLYMVVHARLTEGPEVTISFNSAEGLEAGKTRLRYLSVDIGVVEDVTLDSELDKVVVTVKLDLEAKPLLREDTRFWVVRARVGGGSISGIDTILSGAYLHLDPGVGKPGKREYTGLEVPPLTAADAPGVRLVLFSENADSVSAGDDVLYNGYTVGRIESISFDSVKGEVRYDAFIDAPYDDLVNTSSRFWNISGVSVEASASGVRIATGSLETILLGGVAFGNLVGLQEGEKVASGAVFKLHSSFADIQADPFQAGARFITTFVQSLRGLQTGAPVEFRGIQIGRVEKILTEELASERLAGEAKPIPVLMYLEPGRLGLDDNAESVELMRQNIASGIPAGLRASLQTGNLLTGQLYVNFDYYPDLEAVGESTFMEYPVIPSVASGLGRLEQQIGSLLDKFNQLPLADTMTGINTAVTTLDGTLAALTTNLNSLQQILSAENTMNLPTELNLTMRQLRQTLEGLSPESATGQSLSDSVFELNRTLRNLEAFTRTLSENPKAILFPATNSADPVPEASRR